MSMTPQIFGQEKPEANELTMLYTVPVNKSAQVTIFVCNQTSGGETFSIQLRRNLSTDETYISRNTVLASNGVFAFSSIGLNSGQSIYVQSMGGNASFTATGMEFA